MPQRKTVLTGIIGLVVLVVLLSGALPVSGAPAAATPVSTGFPALTPPGPVSNGPPLSLTLTILFTCCSLGLVVGLIVLGFIVSLQKRKIDKPDEPA